MLQEEQGATAVNLAGLPDLVRILSPLESLRDRRELARSVAQWIVDTVAVSCRIDLRDDTGLRTAALVGADYAPEERAVIRVLDTGKPEIDAETNPSVTWIILPLEDSDSTFATLSVALDKATGVFTRAHMRDLGRVASGLASALTQAAAHERANQISQALQASLLPSDLAVGGWFDLAARYVAGTADLRVGGDWYDSQILTDGTVALSVGDVAGHGVEAAAQMGELRSAMAALRLVRSAPDDLIAVVHRLTVQMGYFATAVCVRLDPTGNLVWASAGHLPPMVVHGSGVAEFLRTQQSPPLGAGYTKNVPINRYRLDPGDIVLLYTDGLVERRDVPLDESLGLLLDRVGGRRWSSPTQLVDQVIRERDQATYTGDDIAVLAARWGDEEACGSA